MDVHLYQIFFLVDLYQICNVVPNMEGPLICDIRAHWMPLFYKEPTPGPICEQCIETLHLGALIGLG